MYKCYDGNTNNHIMDMANSQFLDKLKFKWDDLHKESGVFSYQIGNLRQRTAGQYLMLLNPERGSNRRSPEAIDQICQPFDAKKFNFTKVAAKEVLFTLVSDNDESDKHSIIINVSPISRYHSLICPSVFECLPQIVTEQSLKVVLEIMYYAKDRDLRIGFNSLCAFASVNHLHYHMLFERQTIPVETERCKNIKGPLYCLEDYIVPAFCFEVTPNYDQFVREAFKLISFLLQKSIAHNILISRGRGLDSCGEITRMIIYPRKTCVGAKQLKAFNVAVCELSGWMPVYDPDYFEYAQSVDLERELKTFMYEDFDELCNEVKLLY